MIALNTVLDQQLTSEVVQQILKFFNLILD